MSKQMRSLPQKFTTFLRTKGWISLGYEQGFEGVSIKVNLGVAAQSFGGEERQIRFSSVDSCHS